MILVFILTPLFFISFLHILRIFLFFLYAIKRFIPIIAYFEILQSLIKKIIYFFILTSKFFILVIHSY